MATPGTIPDPEGSAAADSGGTFRVDDAWVDWTFDGPTLFLSEPGGDTASLERLFACAEDFARGRFAVALVLRLADGDARLEACRGLRFVDAAGHEFEGYVTLVRDVA